MAKKILKQTEHKKNNTKASKTKSGAVKKTDKNSSNKTIKQDNKTVKKTKDKEEKEIANIKDGKELAEKTKEIENNIESSIKDRTRKKTKRTEKLFTHDGHKLTPKEAKFIDLYIETGNVRQSVIDAGFNSNTPGQYGNSMLHKHYIMNEIDWRMTQEHNSRIATGEQVMEFFTRVMNGEEKDQFGLDAPLGERIKAGQELAKRTVDIATKVAGLTQGQNEVTIKLDFDRNTL